MNATPLPQHDMTCTPAGCLVFSIRGISGRDKGAENTQILTHLLAQFYRMSLAKLFIIMAELADAADKNVVDLS
jgi:hypothetical protein